MNIKKTLDRVFYIIVGFMIIETILYGTYKFGMFCLVNNEWADVC